MKRNHILAALALLLTAGIGATGDALAQMLQSPMERAALRVAKTKAKEAGQPRIVGGAMAIPGAYPFQVALVLADAPIGQEFAGFFCGGSLIGDRHVLTAAHCLISPSGDPTTDPKQIEIYLGHSSFRGGERIKLRHLTAHPEWNAVTLVNDIAVLELDHAPAASSAVGRVAIASGQGVPTTLATIIGWGSQAQGGSTTRVLREASLSLVDSASCNKNFTQWRNGQLGAVVSEISMLLGFSRTSEQKLLAATVDGAPAPIAEGMICASSPVGNKSTCNGDSGGPMLIQDGEALRQLGVVSWGVGCQTREVQAVFTDVRKYAGWIAELTR